MEELYRERGKDRAHRVALPQGGLVRVRARVRVRVRVRVRGRVSLPQGGLDLLGTDDGGAIGVITR